MLQDIRYALRLLGRHPLFSLSAIAMLALGMAATSSILSVVKGVLLAELPFADPDRLVLIENVKDKDGKIETWPTSYADFSEWRQQTAALDLELFTAPQSFNLTAGEAERVSVELVTSGYFELLGMTPLFGRAFTAADDGPGAERLAVLSHGLWQRRFGGDKAVLDGGELELAGRRFQVIGVLPAGFRGLSDEADAWLPVGLGPELLHSRFLERRAVRVSQVVGRLRDGASLAQAELELAAVAAAQAAAEPRTNQGLGVRLQGLADAWFGGFRFRLLMLLAGALLVLAIASANVAHLMLVRALARRREMGLRQVLGADRGRLVRLWMIESLVLVAIAGGLGLWLAGLGTELLVKVSGAELRSFVNLRLDASVVAAVVGVVLCCTVAVALAPALSVRRQSLAPTLVGGDRGAVGPQRRGLQNALVVGEVALSLFLLIGAGLMLKGFERFRHRDLGYRTDLLTLRLDLKGERYATADAMRTLQRRLLEHCATLPEIRSATLAGPGVPGDSWYVVPFYAQDRLDDPDGGMVLAAIHHVTPGYFASLGISLRDGRLFGVEDAVDAEEPALVISERLARSLWPPGEALGRRMRLSNRQLLRVVGVVADIEQKGLRDIEWPAPDVYLNIEQVPSQLFPQINLLLRPRAGLDAHVLVPRLRRELRELVPDLPPFDIATLDDRLDEQTGQDRFLVLLMGCFAMAALILAMVGLYGIAAIAVVERRREIGVRMALGARPGDVLRSLLGRLAWLVTVGTALGGAFAFALSRLLDRLIYGLPPYDGAVFALATAVLASVAAIATWWPTRRATAVDPVRVLRGE